MILKTKNKEIQLVFRTRKLVDIKNTLKGKNFEEVFFKAMSELDLRALSIIIYSFSENDERKHSFNNSDEVYDFIDDYKVENNKQYIDIFKEIAEAVNNEGFFNSKMTKKQLEEKISNPFSTINLEDMVKPSVEKAISNIIAKEVEVSMA